MSGQKNKRRIMDEVSHFKTLLGEKTRFVGTISGSDNCIIYGQVEGDCHCEGVLVLGEQGRWQGNIEAPSVVISGDVVGDIKVTEKLELSSTAHVKGRISSPVIAMAEGAIHVGEIRMEKPTDMVHYKEKRSKKDVKPPAKVDDSTEIK